MRGTGVEARIGSINAVLGVVHKKVRLPQSVD